MTFIMFTVLMLATYKNSYWLQWIYPSSSFLWFTFFKLIDTNLFHLQTLAGM